MPCSQGRTGVPSGRELRTAWTALTKAACQACASSSFSQPCRAGDAADTSGRKSLQREGKQCAFVRSGSPDRQVVESAQRFSRPQQACCLSGKAGRSIGLASVRSSRPRMWDFGHRSRKANSCALWLRPAAMLHTVLVCRSFTVNSRRLTLPTAQLPDSGHT